MREREKERESSGGMNSTGGCDVRPSHSWQQQRVMAVELRLEFAPKVKIYTI